MQGTRADDKQARARDEEGRARRTAMAAARTDAEPRLAPASLRTILSMALPAIGAQLLQTGVLYADRIMLGHYSGGALAAMQIAGPIEWTLVSITSAYAVGTLALVGRAYGAGDRESIRRHTTLGVTLAIGLGALVAVLALALLPILPALFPRASQGPSGSLTLAREYFAMALWAAPFYCVGAAGFAALSACRDTVTPLKIGLVVNVVHVAVNYLLIGHADGTGRFGLPGMGARGAGLSTALTFVLEAALTLWALSRSIRPFRWPWHEVMGRDDLRALVRVSLPAATEKVIYHAGYIAFVWMIALLGDDGMAANQALIAIEAITFTTVEGFATACGALVAQELGAGRPTRARRVGIQAAALGVATLSRVGVGFFVFRHQLPALVTPRGDLQDAAAGALVVMAIAQPFMAMGVVLGQGLRGAGATRLSLVVSIAAGFFVRLAVTWWATHGLALGIAGVW